MTVAIIVAVSENGVIGRDNALPWHLPADLRHFKNTTLGHPILMGRRTLEANGRTLPGRRNIVITRNTDYHFEGAETAPSIEAAIALCSGVGQLFIIGGAQVYHECLAKNLVDEVYLTRIHATVEGDAHFALPSTGWHKASATYHLRDDKHTHAMSFEHWLRTHTT